MMIGLPMPAATGRPSGTTSAPRQAPKGPGGDQPEHESQQTSEEHGGDLGVGEHLRLTDRHTNV